MHICDKTVHFFQARVHFLKLPTINPHFDYTGQKR
jgi:hypothetical protein